MKWISHICTEHSESNHQSPKTPTEIFTQEIKNILFEIFMLFRRMYKKGFKANFFMYSGGHSARLSNTFTLLPLCSAGTDHPLVFFLVVVCLPLMSGCSPNEQGFKNKKCPPHPTQQWDVLSFLQPTENLCTRSTHIRA